MSMITHAKLILVEGKDEVEFFGDFLSKYGYTSFQILPHNGKDNFKNTLKLVVNDQTLTLSTPLQLFVTQMITLMLHSKVLVIT